MILITIYYLLYYIRPTEWVPEILGAPILMGVGVLSLLSIGSSVLNRKYPQVLNGETEIMMGGFVVSIILSNLSHFNAGGVINSLSLFLPSVTGFLLVSCMVDNQKRVKATIMLLVALTTFLAYEGWLQHTTGFSHGGLEPVYERNIMDTDQNTLIRRIRWYGVFGDPNDLGLALVLVVPFLLNMLLSSHYLVPLISLPLVVSAIYYTNSRGTLLAGLVTLGSYFVIRYRSLYGLLLGCFLSVLFFLFGPSRMAAVSTEDSSAYGRIEAWYAAYQMFKAHPIFGVGQGMFVDYNILTAHNSFVLVMAELGFVGLFFFTGFFYYPFSWLWVNYFKNNNTCWSREDLGLISAAFASLTGVLAAMFFISRAYIMIPFMLVAIIVAIIRTTSGDLYLDTEPRYGMKRHLRIILLLTILQIVGINLVVKIFI